MGQVCVVPSTASAAALRPLRSNRAMPLSVGSDPRCAECVSFRPQARVATAPATRCQTDMPFPVGSDPRCAECVSLRPQASPPAARVTLLNAGMSVPVGSDPGGSKMCRFVHSLSGGRRLRLKAPPCDAHEVGRPNGLSSDRTRAGSGGCRRTRARGSRGRAPRGRSGRGGPRRRSRAAAAGGTLPARASR